MSNSIPTKSEQRALIAVDHGEVIRIYRRDGNVLKHRKSTILSRTLWSLSNKGWIEDGPDKTSGWQITATQILTKAGCRALEHGNTRGPG